MSPVLDPKAAAVLASSKTSKCQSSSLEEFEFEPAFKVSKNDWSEDNENLDDMIELPNKRKASLSPETKELSRKEKKAAKREQKLKSKSEQKAKLVLDVSPNKN